MARLTPVATETSSPTTGHSETSETEDFPDTRRPLLLAAGWGPRCPATEVHGVTPARRTEAPLP